MKQTATIQNQPGSRRLQVRSEVSLAARQVAPLWPARTVIAVNPLLGMLEQPFVEAVREARADLGADGFRSIADFRDDYADGNISAHNLRASLVNSVSGASNLMPIPTPAGEIDALELLIADLLHGPEPGAATVLESTAARCDRLIGSTIASEVDRILSRWLAAYTDFREGSLQMPIDRNSFHEAARELAATDPDVAQLIGGASRSKTELLCSSPEESIDRALADLGISAARRIEEIRAQLLRLRGWAGWIKWRTEWSGEHCEEVPIDLVELAAVRLSLEAAAVASAIAELNPDDSRLTANSRAKAAPSLELPGQRLDFALESLGFSQSLLSADSRARAHATLARLGDSDRLAVWLGAQEAAYRDGLLAKLNSRSNSLRASRPSAQVVFCIDVRSEGIRRHLEAEGDCETLGFAGFFAVAVNFRPFGSGNSTALCPVLLSPNADIEEVALSARDAERVLNRRARDAAFVHAFHSAKSGVASPFALAEAGGLVAGWITAARTFSLWLAERLSSRGGMSNATSTELRVTAGPGVNGGFTFQEQVKFAHAALTMMGLTESFSRLVVFCSHGSRNINNPFGSALDCGACGGNGGAPNARIAAGILNRTEVRTELARAGIEIPHDTVFAAADHETAANKVSILDRHLIPASHSADLQQLESALDAAGTRLASEQEAKLPGSGLRGWRRALPSRGSDWSQVRPEWGLAGNAAFIVGSRAITQGLDLGCRTFLHSYDAEIDSDGAALETILTAPLVVAHWINSQYYFSTVDPTTFGAGDKTLHNVIGNGCVVAGSGGDLKVGLPWQSVGVGDKAVHEPLRLLAVVEAPLDRIERIIGEQPILQHLIGGGWVTLTARSNRGSEWHIRSQGGTWSSWVPPTPLRETKSTKEAVQ